MRYSDAGIFIRVEIEGFGNVKFVCTNKEPDAGGNLRFTGVLIDALAGYVFVGKEILLSEKQGEYVSWMAERFLSIIERQLDELNKVV